MVEAHMARDDVGDWKPYYVWFPRKFDGKWHWRITMFRRKVWNQFDSWYEYSFLPVPGTPVFCPSGHMAGHGYSFGDGHRYQPPEGE